MTFVGLHAEPVSEASTPPNVDPSRAGGGGRHATPAARARGRLGRLMARVRGSVWAPVALKSTGIALGLLTLAGIGAASILSNTRGVALAASLPHRADRHGGWLAAAPPSPREHRAAHSRAAARADAGAVKTHADAGTRSDAGPSGVTPDGKVILNVASAEELTRLPGVGAKRAESIIALRRRLKRFRRASQLLRVRGIGVKSLRRILPHVVLDPPKPPKSASDAG